jgi:tetratricopeptide (TPR) repeat protein
VVDPLGAAVGASLLDSTLGRLLGTGGRIARKTSFSWRIAYRAHAAAKELGYVISLKQLRSITRQKVVKDAVKWQRPTDVAEAKSLLAQIRSIRVGAADPSANELFELVRTGYLGAAEQVDRDLGIREEVRATLHLLTVNGGSGAPLWRANASKIPPFLAADAEALRDLYGSAVERVVHEIANADDRPALLRSWAAARPDWLPCEGRVFGWLGEVSFEVDAPDAARRWFDDAISAGAVPIEYWRVRRAIVELDAPHGEAVAIGADMADHPLVRALTAPDFGERLAQSRLWPTQSNTQASLRMSLIVENLLSMLDFDEAIRTGTEAFESDGFSGAGTHAVEAYMRRSAYQPGAHASDLSAGLALALRIRDARRSWGVSSGVVLSKAIKASTMLSDVDRALTLSRRPEATPEEATHPDVRREAVVVMTLLDNVRGAREMVDDATPLWIRLQVESKEAELLGEQDRANNLLAGAIDAADDPNQKAPLCFRLASRGVLHPFVESMRELNPDTVADLELVAALVNGESGAEERARQLASERATVAISLIEYFELSGRRRDVIFTAERAAAKWADPDLWLRAARTLHLEGRYSDAIDRASKALESGGAAWGSRSSAFIVQIEAATAKGDWTTAIASTQSLIRLQPRSADAHWALVRLRRNSGDVDQAYRDWRAGPKLDPRSPEEAALWFDFFRVHGSEVATLQHLFTIATRFAAHQQLRNLALGALLGAPSLAEPIGELNFGTLLAQFEATYPGQHGVRKIQLGEDAEGPEIVEAIQAAIGPKDESRQALLAAVSAGSLPVGFSSHYLGRHVAEMLNLLHKSPRFAGSLSPGEQDKAIAAALEVGAVADVTALFTLTLLSEEHSGVLAARFPGLVTTSEQMLDASAARESFNRDPGGSLFHGTENGKMSFRRSDPIEHEVQRLNSVRLVEWFRRSNRQAGRPLVSEIAKTLESDDDTWMTALDLAARTDTPLWCDDAATRAVATEAGALVFDTPSLVAYLRRKGTISESLGNALDVDLIHNGTVGVAYREAVFDAVGRLDQMAPQGLAIAIRHGGPGHAQDKINFIVRAMGAVIALPDQVATWAGVAFKYLGDITSDASSAHDNRVIFLNGLLIQPWLSPSSLTFIVGAARAEVGPGWDDVFRDAFQRMLSQVSIQTDGQTAAKFALALTAGLEENERRLALAVIMAP